LVNSRYGGLAGRIVSIHQAIVLLGFNTVKNLASRLVLGSPRAATGAPRGAP
jgi:HD-like signal output (HDOD) protein